MRSSSLDQLPKPACRNDPRPVIAHVIHRLDVGGLENGLVNLINRMPSAKYRHIVICMTDHTDFGRRFHRDDVEIIALHKQEGLHAGIYFRLWSLLRRLAPDVVHTRNLSTLEGQLPAALAGVPVRIHGEQGHDMGDLGSSRKYNLLRKCLRPFVHHYTTVSKELRDWLIQTIGISPARVSHIYNGVDLSRFHPRQGSRPAIGPAGFVDEGMFVIGTVGRLQTVKDPLTLVRAFLYLLDRYPETRDVLRLVVVGDGPMRDPISRSIRDAGREQLTWLAGERSDIPDLLRFMDLFVLPSLAEGASNSILEAMASGLPVVATYAGGNAELIDAYRTGLLVTPSNPRAMADAIRLYLTNRELPSTHGKAGRTKVEEKFGLDVMVRGYVDTYDALLETRSLAGPPTLTVVDRASTRSQSLL